MRLISEINNWFAPEVLTQRRIWLAFFVAVTVDIIQLLLGPAGWFFFDEGLDVAAMLLTSAALGFHLLLLPTFALEILPFVDMLPTWTGCVAAVIMLRKKAQSKTTPPPPPPGSPIIDVSSEVTQVPPK